MNKKITFFVIIALISGLAAFAQTANNAVPEEETFQDVNLPLTVDGAVTLSFLNNPVIIQSKLGSEIANANRKQANASNIPNFSVGATGSYVEKLDYTTSTYNFTVTWPILPLSRFDAIKKAAKENYTASEYSFLRAIEQVRYQTESAFYQYLLAYRMMEVAEQAVSISENSLRIANLQYQSGLSARVDVDQATATLESSRVSLLRAQNGVALSKSALFMTMGLSADTDLPIDTSISGVPTFYTDIDTLKNAALASRPDRLALEHQIKALTENARGTKASHLPSLNLQASYTNHLAGDSLGQTGVTGITVGASASFNIFDGGISKNAEKATELQVEQTKQSLKFLDLSIGLDVQQSYLNLIAANRQFNGANAQLTAASEALRIAELRYQEGQGILLEVEQAQFSVTSARSSVAQAEVDALTAFSALKYAVGDSIYNLLFVDVN